MSLNFTSGSKNDITSRNIKRYDKTPSASNVIASLIKESTTEPWEYPFTSRMKQKILCNSFNKR